MQFKPNNSITLSFDVLFRNLSRFATAKLLLIRWVAIRYNIMLVCKTFSKHEKNSK